MSSRRSNRAELHRPCQLPCFCTWVNPQSRVSRTHLKGTKRPPPFVTITHQNRTTIPTFFTCPNPPTDQILISIKDVDGLFNIPNTIRMIPIIPHFPIRKQLARPDEISQLRHRLLWIVSFCSIEIAPEDAAVLEGLRADIN